MKKKLLFIIWSYTYGGGAEALLTMIVNNLNSQKYDISIIEYEHAEIKVEKVNKNIHLLPPIERVETSDGKPKGYQVRYTELLIDRYIKGDYDLYIAFNYQIPTFLLPKNTKNISWIHGDVYVLNDKERENDKRLQDEAFDKVDKIVAISDNTLRSLEDLFPRHRDKMMKLYNGIDIEDIRRKSQEKTSIHLKHPAIVFSGRFDDNKDPLRLLRVFTAVYRNNPRIHLYYLGKGALQDKICELAEAEGIQDNVHLLAYQSNPFPIIRQADVVCLLSKSEGFSMALLEATALGKPVVTTRVGAAETVTNGGKCGKVVCTDKEAAEAILYYANCDKKKLQKECWCSAKRFGLMYYIQQIEKLIDEVIASGGGPDVESICNHTSI